MVLWLSGIWLGSSAIPILRLVYSRKSNQMFAVNCSGVIVIVLSAVMYAATYSKLKEHSKNIALQNSTESRAQETRILKEKQFLKTIILIAFIAFVCIVPSMIYFQLQESLNFSKDNLVHVILFQITSLIFYANFAVNPLIYILRLRNYRKTFYLIYCRRGSPY
jgi:Na+/melibiose symporter-like transporter